MHGIIADLIIVHITSHFCQYGTQFTEYLMTRFILLLL